jgi:hypothetical protein
MAAIWVFSTVRIAARARTVVAPVTTGGCPRCGVRDADGGGLGRHVMAAGAAQRRGDLGDARI